jgi:hypothetical protein
MQQKKKEKGRGRAGYHARRRCLAGGRNGGGRWWTKGAAWLMDSDPSYFFSVSRGIVEVLESLIFLQHVFFLFRNMCFVAKLVYQWIIEKLSWAAVCKAQLFFVFVFVKPYVQPQFKVSPTKTKPSFNLTKHIFMWLTLNFTRSHITKQPLSLFFFWKVNYFSMFGSVMENKLENTFQCLVMSWKMRWKITY